MRAGGVGPRDFEHAGEGGALSGMAGIGQQLLGGIGLVGTGAQPGVGDRSKGSERRHCRDDERRARDATAHRRGGVTTLRVASRLTGSSETEARTACASATAGTFGVTRSGEGTTRAAVTTAATAAAAAPKPAIRGTRRARRARASVSWGASAASQNPGG